MKILVCDDEPKRIDVITECIKEARIAEPSTLIGGDLTGQLKLLFDHIGACLKKPSSFEPRETPFDDADVVIIDNNLAHLDVSGARLTGESIAGYIRAFTGAPYIVSLNKNPDVDFDLRFLIGDYSTRADLALNTEHLAHRALWTGKALDSTNGFLPWYWPALCEVKTRREKQIEFVSRHLDLPIIETLGFDDEAVQFLSPHAQGALSPRAGVSGQAGLTLKKVTFRDVFLALDRSLPAKEDREKLSKAEKGGNGPIRRLMSRVIASDIDHWFRRDVLSPQSVLVDVAHLLSRMPFLLNKPKDPDAWNKSLASKSAPFGLNKDLFAKHLRKTMFKHEMWTQRPVFWWPKLKADKILNERFFRAKEMEWADMVFCEDRSGFVKRLGANGAAATVEFPAEFEGSWSRRHVASISGIKYAPRSRLFV